METIELENLQDLNRVAFVYGMRNIYLFTDGIMHDVLNDLSDVLYDRWYERGTSAWDEFFTRNPEERKLVRKMAFVAIEKLVLDGRLDSIFPYSSFRYGDLIKSISKLL